MATLPYDNSKVTAALINSLTGNQVATFVKNAAKFAAAVNAGKSASITIGKTTFQFSVGKSPAVAKVLFSINGAPFDPVNSTTFTAVALIKAAAAQLSLTAGIDAPFLTTDNNTVNAPAGTLQDKDVISDPSSTDNDAVNAVFLGNIKPTIRNIETINFDVQVGGKPLDTSLITHDSAGTIAFSTTVGIRTLGDITGLSRNVGLSFSSGNWSVGAIKSSDTNTGVQALPLTLSGTNLTVTNLGGTTQATDIDILNVNSIGTSANVIQLPNGVDINESGEAVVVSGKQGLTLRTDNIGANGINVTKSSMSGTITLDLTALSVPTGSSALPPLDFSAASIDRLRLYGDQSNVPITLVSGVVVDLRRDQPSGITLNTKGAFDTAADAVTLSLTDDNPSLAPLTDGAIDIAGGIDLTGSKGTGIYANQFEKLSIVLAAPPLTTSTATHQIGIIQGGVVNGTTVSISGPDNLVLAGFDEKVLSIDATGATAASGMSGQFTLTNIDPSKAAGHVVSGGRGSKDTLTAITSTAGVTADLSSFVVKEMGTANSFRLSGFENLTFSTGNDSVSGATTAESLNGSDGDDTITGGGGADVLIGGIGNDVFAYNAEGDSPAVVTGTTFSGDCIDDFSSGVDLIRIDKVGAIDFSLSTTFNVNPAITLAGATTFATVIGAVPAPVASTVANAQVYDIMVATGPLMGHYLLINDATANITAADLMIKLTGTSSSALAVSDFLGY